jgi:cytoskeletal protein RodZ
MSDSRRQTLGEFLKSERERRGLTIEQTSSATKVGLKILRQLESDNYAELPALPFVRGFVRNYAKFLGIDSERLLADYASFLEEHSRDRPKRDAGHSGYAFERPEGEQSKKVLWGVMAAMVVFGGVVVLVFKPSLHHKRHGSVDQLRASPVPGASVSPVPGPDPSILAMLPLPSPSAGPSGVPSGIPSALPSATPSAVATSSPSPTPSPSPSPVVSPSPTPSPAPAPSPSPTAEVAKDDLKADPLQSGVNYEPREVRYKVVLRASTNTWVRYQCDDKKQMKFVLKGGKILVLRGKERLRLQVSNPDTVTFQTPGGPESPVSASASAFIHHGNATLVWPAEDREKIDQIFKVTSPLPSSGAAPSPTLNPEG